MFFNALPPKRMWGDSPSDGLNDQKGKSPPTVTLNLQKKYNLRQWWVKRVSREIINFEGRAQKRKR